MLEAGRLDEPGRVTGRKCLSYGSRRIDVEDRLGEVPVAVDPVGINLAKIRLIEETGQGVAQKDIALDTGCGFGRFRFDELCVEVAGGQSVLPSACYCRG